MIGKRYARKCGNFVGIHDVSLLSSCELVPATCEYFGVETLRHGFESWELNFGMVVLKDNAKKNQMCFKIM